MKRVLGLTALSLVVAAFSGTAIGLPGGEDDRVQLTTSVDHMEILRCIGYAQTRLTLHNTTADHQYGDVFLRPTGPLQVSRSQWSTYTPTGLDPALALRVRVERAAPSATMSSATSSATGCWPRRR